MFMKEERLVYVEDAPEKKVLFESLYILGRSGVNGYETV